MKSYICSAAVTVPILFMLSGCGPKGDFPTAQTSGVVLCEGQPVEGAMVYFEPLGGTDPKASAKTGKQGFSWTDAEGKYVISTYDPGGEDGAVIGNHRVRVGKGKSNCGCVTNDESDLMKVEVKAGENNVFEIVLPKKTGKERPDLRDDDDED